MWYSFANEWYLSRIDSRTKFAAVQLLIVSAVPLPYTQYQLHLLDVVFLVVLQVFQAYFAVDSKSTRIFFKNPLSRETQILFSSLPGINHICQMEEWPKHPYFSLCTQCNVQCGYFILSLHLKFLHLFNLYPSFVLKSLMEWRVCLSVVCLHLICLFSQPRS